MHLHSPQKAINQFLYSSPKVVNQTLRSLLKALNGVQWEKKMYQDCF